MTQQDIDNAQERLGEQFDRLAELDAQLPGLLHKGDFEKLAEVKGKITDCLTAALVIVQNIGEAQYEELLRTQAERDAALAEVARLRALSA